MLYAGPLHEFFHISMKVVQDGIGYSPKPVYFEEQADHKVPVHNQARRQMGSFQALGKIIRQSLLRDGPSLCGLSDTVKRLIVCLTISTFYVVSFLVF